MRMSSSLVAPSAVAVLSTVLLSGTAASQTATGPTNQLPGITVVAPKQVARPVARPQRQAPPVANTVAARPTSPAAQTPPTSAQKPAPGSVMARIAAIEKTSSSCTDGCQTSFKHGNQPWNGCSVSSGDFTFIDNLQKRRQLQNLPGVQGNRNVFGLETMGGLVVLQQPARRGQAFRGEASGRRFQAIRTSLVHTAADLRLGQSLLKWGIRATSAFLPIATVISRRNN